MPTFTANRSSSAILKSVLHESSGVGMPLRNNTGVDGLPGTVLDKPNIPNPQNNKPLPPSENVTTDISEKSDCPGDDAT